ncbi:MAG TPA: hypothetical protein VFY25_10770 [Anaerolineales bacterium]|nr:hypothetical protein [Anaerolineales bacterium]
MYRSLLPIHTYFFDLALPFVLWMAASGALVASAGVALASIIAGAGAFERRTA